MSLAEKLYRWSLYVLAGVMVGFAIFGIQAGDDWATIVANFGFALLFLTWSWLLDSAKSNARFVGYWKGRHDMWTSMREASERGMSFVDWQVAEREREAHMLGMADELGLEKLPEGD